MIDPLPPRSQALMRTGLRIAILLLAILAVNFGVSWMKQQLSAADSGLNDSLLTSIIILSLLLYVLLMAIPFVPGMEIGVSLMMLQGPSIAPLVFLSTFSGLSLSFLLGRYLPYSYLHRVLADLHLRRACALLERLQDLDQTQRLDILKERLPNWLAVIIVKYRYLTLAIALNIPGNSLIGGGGGIAMIAGLSRLFSPIASLATIAIAVSPVAIAFFFFGAKVFNSW